MCEKNSDVESFLKDKAVLFEKKHKSRTYLVVDELKLNAGVFEILAYFSLAVQVLKIPDNLSKEKIKKLDGLYKNTSEIPVYLIGQLAKNDAHKDQIDGSEVINLALSIIMKSFKYVGGRIILVECDDNPKLIDYYTQSGFDYFQRDEEFIHMIKFLSLEQF